MTSFVRRLAKAGAAAKCAQGNVIVLTSSPR
jgi:hypothetical protein